MTNPYQYQRSLGWMPLLVVAVAFSILAVVSANFLLTLASLLVLVVIVKLLWRPGEPPVLLLAMVYHWLQACTLTMEANLQGVALADLGSSPGVTLAAWLSLAGVAVISLGIRFGAGRNFGPENQSAVTNLPHRLSDRKLFIGSLIAIALSQAITSFAWAVPGLSQPLLALNYIHWLVFYLLAFVILAQRRNYHFLGIVFLVEMVVGFLGYFSGFKDVLIIMMLATMAAPAAFRSLHFRTAALLAIGAIFLGLVWTSIKADYRGFLNLGTETQVVLVPVEKRIGKLVELTSELTPEKFSDALENFSSRLGYVKFFGDTIRVVPDVIPYENGKLWEEALVNSLVPRLLNPEKRVLNDSERTSHYTGGYVAGVQEGASISLGYIAESYIDFGPVWMMAPLLAWGLFIGWIFRVLVRSAPHPLLGFGSATALIALGASLLETSNVKMVGGIVLGFLVLFVFQKTLGQRLLHALGKPADQS